MKYRTPPTLPSFLPSGSSSSTPTHWPLANSVVPQNRSVPVWRKQGRIWLGWALGGHDQITGTGNSLVVQWLRVSTCTAEGSVNSRAPVPGDLTSCTEWPKKKKKNHWHTSSMVECVREPQAQISASQLGHHHSLAM